MHDRNVNIFLVNNPTDKDIYFYGFRECRPHLYANINDFHLKQNSMMYKEMDKILDILNLSTYIDCINFIDDDSRYFGHQLFSTIVFFELIGVSISIIFIYRKQKKKN